MKKTLLLTILILLLFVGYSNAACTGSSPTWTSTPDLTSLQTCVTNATRGDTINVSAGSANWDGTLAITKALTIKGAGKTQTLITNTRNTNQSCTDSCNWMVTYIPSSASADADVPFRITGFSFDGDFKTSILKIYNNSEYTLNKVRIDNNIFKDGFYVLTTGTTDRTTLLTRGPIHGVIDSNEITGMPNWKFFGRLNGVWEWNNKTWTPGTTNTLFIEDNVLTWDNTTATDFAGSGMGGGWGNTYVLRYNQYNLTNLPSGISFVDLYDSHYGGSSWIGTMGMEIYGNRITRAFGKTYTWAAGFGGSENLYFYNSTNITTQPWVRYQTQPSLVFADTWYSCTSSTGYNNLHGSGYKCNSVGQPQHINRTYAWNNRYGSGGDSYFNRDTASANFGVLRNTHYFNPMDAGVSFDGTSGVGCGTLAARPATCTTGVGYWATNQSCSDLTNHSGTNPTQAISGTLYRCVSTNNWQSYYTPAAYPHALRSEGPSDTEAPAPYGTASPTGPQSCTGVSDDVTLSFQVTDSSTVTCRSCKEGTEGCDADTTYAEMVAMTGETVYTSSGSSPYTQTASYTSLCNTSYKHWARCIDNSTNANVMTSSIGITYQMQADVDEGDPELLAQEVEAGGTRIKLTFDEDVQFGTGGNGGFTLTRNRGGVIDSPTLTYDTGSGSTTLYYTVPTVILSTDVITITYVQPGQGVVDKGSAPATYCDSCPDTAKNANKVCEVPDGTSGTSMEGLCNWTDREKKRYSFGDPLTSNGVSFTETCDETESLGCLDIGTTNCIRIKKTQYAKDEDVYAFKLLESDSAGLIGHIYLQFYFKNMDQPTDGTGTGPDGDCDFETADESDATGEYTCTGEKNMEDGHDVEVIGFTPGAKTTYAALPADYPANVYIGLQQRSGNLTLSAFHYTTHNHEIRGTTDVDNDGSEWVGVRLHIYNSATAGEDYYEFWVDWDNDGVFTKIGDSRASYYDHSTSSNSSDAITFSHPFRYIVIGQNDLEGRADFQITGIKVNHTAEESSFPSGCNKIAGAYNELASFADVAVDNNSEQGSLTTNTIFDQSIDPPPGWEAQSTTNFNSGIRFSSSTAAIVSKICYYKDALITTGSRIGTLYGPGGTVLSQVTFSSESASGWQCQSLSPAINILANTTYTAAVYFPVYWGRSTGFFGSSYSNDGTLTAQAENGWYVFSTLNTPAYPSIPSGANYRSNFWIDIELGSGTGPWEATVTNSSATGAKCSITEPASTKMSIANGATGEAVVVVSPGWKAAISGCGGSTVQDGNNYTFTTAAMSADCEITVLCSEKQVVPWIAE